MERRGVATVGDTVDEESYHVICTDGWRLDRVVLGKASAVRTGRVHYDQTGHPVAIKAVHGGETIQIGE